ncbi:immune inhibitor A domain-containing protein [Tumebacillus permanentifrigoris]|uniref:Antibacterial peptide protease n=1 Tax=Tumebacillus permanentifrigoris TaxID=378543 RepID=A0A316D753_9BACL|nr:immune inhibitor A domain-containing protein [Tumebacillus permanentifrigoris]PWK08437.1 antibacterial peptide protease [Tumebacillus permanentifrigoris]
MNRKLFTLGLTSALVAGTVFTVTPATLPAAAQAPDTSIGHDAAPLDLGIVNQDRMIQSLIERGVIPQGLTPEQQTQAMNQYLQTRVNTAQTRTEKNNSSDKRAAMRTTAKAGTVSATAPSAAVPQAWNGSLRKDKILVLLVEYNDYAHNNISSSETDNYFSDYSTEHYRQMLFSPTGYTGPDGKNKISMVQYYLQQSGGSYTVDGDVYGWLKAPKGFSAYGGNVDDSDNNPRGLIRDALAAASANGVPLSSYDQEDIYDLDGDGNTREPDGLVDHLMVIHAGVGEEAGGGSLGDAAIWSHRWDLGSPYAIPGTKATVPYWGGAMGAFDYTVEPEDGATGVFSHEYGHDLGLPDEYDTIYSGNGEPVEYYSIMSAGSWAGDVPGSEPTGFSPYAKEFYQQTIGGNWQQGKRIGVSDIPAAGLTYTLDQASTHGTNDDVVRIDLPDNVTSINTPATGSYEYYGGRKDEMDNKMSTTVDLTGATSASLDYDTWYKMEQGWDYSMVQVSTDNGTTWKSLATPHTTTDIVADGYPTIIPNLPGYTGDSGGWLHETIDLSAYAGQKIQLQFRSMTDWGTNLDGFFVDNVKVTKNGSTLLSDGAEGTSLFTLNGFSKHEGKYATKHHYLVEWRNHQGVDQGLAHIRRGTSLMSYDPGMLIWYVNEAYDDNWTAAHPGKGFLGVVDSHQNVHHWGGNDASGAIAGTRYQIFDAAFSLKKGSDLDVYYDKGFHLYNAAKNPNPIFDDKTAYWSPSSSDSGLKLPSYGLKIQVLSEAADRSTATIKITK